MTTYFDPIFSRLEPRTPFQGGRITDTDVLNLGEAARFASVHAGTEITPADFLRAAGRGEITLRAIVHQTAKLQKIGGGVYCNAGQSNENTVPMRSILNLPLSACQQLAATGRASWRKFDGFEQIDGVLMRYAIAELMSDESDFETTTDDCRVTGNAVNALADAFIEAPAQTATPAPVVQATETQEKRQDRRLKACIDAGLPMNEKAASLRLPYGVANIAKSEGVTRQAFSTDVKAALKRRDSAKREGVTVHRT